jgi:hypothetical protein
VTRWKGNQGSIEDLSNATASKRSSLLIVPRVHYRRGHDVYDFVARRSKWTETPQQTKDDGSWYSILDTLHKSLRAQLLTQPFILFSLLTEVMDPLHLLIIFLCIFSEKKSWQRHRHSSHQYGTMKTALIFFDDNAGRPPPDEETFGWHGRRWAELSGAELSLPAKSCISERFDWKYNTHMSCPHPHIQLLKHPINVLCQWYEIVAHSEMKPHGVLKCLSRFLSHNRHGHETFLKLHSTYPPCQIQGNSEQVKTDCWRACSYNVCCQCT